MRDELLRLGGLLLFIAAVSILIGFISSLDFSNTGLAGFIGGGPHEGEGVPVVPIPSSFSDAKLCNLSATSNPPSTPVFFVEGLNSYTNHLRLFTAKDYVNGVWVEEEVDYDDPMDRGGEHVTRYRVTPIIPFERHIPVAKDTFFVTAKAGYSKKTSTYLVDNFSTPYTAFSSAYLPKAEKATNDAEYLELSCEEVEKIRELALKVTEGAENDYEKAKMIEEFLKNNYEYGFTTYGSKPLYEFLFVKKKGICKHFATAFVMMCRSVGIPARAVFGYLAKPVEYNQTVLASQAHAWAEAKFENGWVEFDPTPAPKRIRTVTEITYADPVVRQGENLTVRGVVKAESGVPSGYVEIYIKRDKNEDGKLLTLVPVENGMFNATVKVNTTGEYHIVAHYLGSMLFSSSWSDPVVKIYGVPEIRVNLSDRVAAGRCLISGSVFTDKPLNGTVELYVDGKKYEKSFNGNFEFVVELSEGKHRIRIYYPGSEQDYILPASYEKVVEAGKVEIFVDNTTAVSGYAWIANASVYFNGEPVKTLMVFSSPFFNFSAVGERIEIRQPVPDIEPSKINVTCYLPEFGYRQNIELRVKETTRIHVEAKGNTITARLTDSRGNPVEGVLYIDGKEVFASDGIARLSFERMPDRIEVIFPGNDLYMPSKAKWEKPFPFWLLLLPLPAVVFFVLRMRGGDTIRFEYEEPCIWMPSDEVEIIVRTDDRKGKKSGKGIIRLMLDGEGVGFSENGLVFKATFPEEGEHVLVAERLEGTKVKERKEFRFKILDYRRAIAEVFGELVKDVEKKKGVSLKNATAREVLSMLGVEDRGILSFFEPVRYGRKGGGRKELVEFYRLCKEVKKHVGS
ncbi:transglutaminase domain-containing protein [Archaeoglobus veneficus]|uniref:Transglutaminase domain-containing protein n=1 Tax=Archaeoglobus veneficus (strain DSM 11195 / SNP6) TaxID=693661 RepID=F2KTC4_ARCVS|nr:transglutaminase domain-containing protein [Archaeoglobus veneficus]AEA47154.1 transglutaminase domain-containing protein [Archaeoglobus veneficus SNP6]